MNGPVSLERVLNQAKPGRVLRLKTKHDSPMWYACTPEQTLLAFRRAFQHIKESEYYNDLTDDDDDGIGELKAKIETMERTPDVFQQDLARDRKLLAGLEKTAASTRYQKELYARALSGDAAAAAALLQSRRDYEYEDWSFDFVQDPARED